MRRTGPLLAAMIWACACAEPRPAAPPPAPAPPPPPPNLEIQVTETIDNPGLDGMAYGRVFIDGREAGSTPIARRSQQKAWTGTVPPGNHPVRLEYWLLPGVGEWVRLDDQWQPPERFIRIKEAGATRLSVRFSDGGKRNDLAVSRLERL